MPKEFFISVAKKDFRLVEAFEIVSESGIAVESEEVFILLSAKALKFFIRKIECPKEVSLEENLSENSAISPAVTDGEVNLHPTTSTTLAENSAILPAVTDSEVNLHPTTSTTLASNAQSADCEATSEDDDITVLDTKVYLFKLVSVT